MKFELDYHGIPRIDKAKDDFLREYVRTVLRFTQGNVSMAARYAGVERSNFRRLARRVGL